MVYCLHVCVGVWVWGVGVGVGGCRCDCEVPLFLQVNELTWNINETSLRVEKVKRNLEFILVCAHNQGKGLSRGYSLFPRPSSPPLVLLLSVSKYGGPGKAREIQWHVRRQVDMQGVVPDCKYETRLCTLDCE